ncbi:MAG: ABC transporter ATP-binding protein [Gemmataceae bacterium]
MSSNLAIDVEKLGKQYHVGEKLDTFPTLRDAIADVFRAPWKRLKDVLSGKAAHGNQGIFWALKDISFQVPRGTVLGVIGRNGAGKSTLLKLLSRITAPTSGWANIYGRVGSLLEVGTGFHPELTGRDNIWLNGAMLGMKRHEILNKFDDIVEFSEIEKFLDTPVKHYSSGMYMRLAFAIAAHLQPEILVVDEVLAVGDAGFQKKCLGKMDSVARDGRTILFVSHSMAAIQNLCPQVMWLESGMVQKIGPTRQVISDYLNFMSEVQKTPLRDRKDRKGSGGVRFVQVAIEDVDGNPLPSFVSGEPAQLVLSLENQTGRTLNHCCFGVGIDDQLGQRIAFLNNQLVTQADQLFPTELQRVTFRIPRLPLVSGKYAITLFLSSNGDVMDWIENAAAFFVEDGDYYGSGKVQPASQGSFLLDYSCEVTKAA